MSESDKKASKPIWFDEKTEFRPEPHENGETPGDVVNSVVGHYAEYGFTPDGKPITSFLSFDSWNSPPTDKEMTQKQFGEFLGNASPRELQALEESLKELAAQDTQGKLFLAGHKLQDMQRLVGHVILLGRLINSRENER